jgi:hypothetical protein
MRTNRTIPRDAAVGWFPATCRLRHCHSEPLLDRDCIEVCESAGCNSDKTDEMQTDDDVAADGELTVDDC